MYIALTVLLAVFGPVIYVDFKPVAVASYMACFLVVFALGYAAGIAVKVPGQDHPIEGIGRRGLQVAKLCIAVSFLYKCQELTALLMAAELDVSVSSIGEAYVNAYADYTRGTGIYSVGYVVSIFFYLPLQVALILGIYHFRNLPGTYKVLLIGTIILLVLVHVIGQGKQKQFGDVLIFALSVLAVRLGARKERAFSVTLTGLAIGAMGLSVLLLILYSRYSALDIDISNVNRFTHPLLEYDATHPVFSFLGDTAGFPVAVFCMYLTGGYQGLSLAFDQPFVWTYGVGHSYALTILADKLLGLPVSVDASYPYRVGAATGWDEAKWHSVFAWLASDMSFAGALLFFLVVAYLYAQCWKDAAAYGNPAAIMLFAVLNLGLAFVPANNQLLHSPEGYLSVVVLLVAWLSTRSAMNSRPSWAGTSMAGIARPGPPLSGHE